MKNNQNLPKPKVESRVSQALKQYSRSQLRSNNLKTTSTVDSKYTLPKPPSQTYQKTQEQNNKIISKYHMRQNNSSIPVEQTRKTSYKQSTERVPEHRSMNKNHSFFESKNEKAENNKRTQRTTYTYKQPESNNLKDNYRERKNNESNNINNNNNNINNNIKKNYDSTSYEHQGRRKRQYENKSYQQEKYPPKYYRNNPNLFNINALKMKGSLVAQKICNIVIKGGSSKIKKESINISNNNRRLNNGREIEYEVEDNVGNYNYNNEEEIEEDSLNDNNEENIIDKKIKKYKKNIRKNKNKKKNYNPIIEMQKAQSFEQPRDFAFMPKQKYTKAKVVIGVEDNNNKNYGNIKDNDKNKFNKYSKPEEKNYLIKNNINNTDNNNNITKPPIKTQIIQTNRSKINQNNNTQENTNTRNILPNQLNLKNINNIINNNSKQNDYANTIPSSSRRSNYPMQSKQNKENKNELNNNKNNAKHEIIISRARKDRPLSSQKVINYLNTEPISKETDKNKNNDLTLNNKGGRKKYTITITTQYRRDNSKNKINENKNEKKYTSYSYVPKRNDKNEIQEKEVVKKIEKEKDIDRKSVV